jgi:hypothetical protein
MLIEVKTHHYPIELKPIHDSYKKKITLTKYATFLKKKRQQVATTSRHSISVLSYKEIYNPSLITINKKIIKINNKLSLLPCIHQLHEIE